MTKDLIKMYSKWICKSKYWYNLWLYLNLSSGTSTSSTACIE